ncbi:uncharacterized protein LOC125663665 [Ostrea edulis]|uniref:uncharacterized protein LOC125663665 n=1 Tax=Ostrea edulis TaxID=37623 RepID=UPI002094FA3C|nr:uncharacterized protein LOC125663665 [Ostrea edulis]XP_048751931.1 uncharacterized protein LOC125663665 [Ostrea edulis]XP_048751932.1 uncharacterized protein LOC125663665 [Ostrea edulis]
MLERVKDPPTMLVFGLFEGDRVSLDVPIGATVGEVKKMFQTKLNIYIDEMNRKDTKVLVLHYSGADLEESWCFTDLGIPAGATVRVLLKEEIKPALYIFTTYNQETIDIVDKNLNVLTMLVEDLRTVAGNKSGLPVSIFRLVTEEGKELYDGHVLYDYGIDNGSTIRLENWDGWNEFINLCIMGFTPQVLSQITTDEVIGRFQQKVALFIAAHYGCADLARVLIKQGIRADEPIGVHPHKLWCTSQAHIETKKAPIHEATEQGQLIVLRLIVNHDITSVMARDGNDLCALNIALRRSKKPCASFLLTRQWTKVPIGKLGSVTVQTLRSIRLWCEGAKDRAYSKFGPNKSSLKKMKFSGGPLVSHGEPVVDGFTKSPMTGKPRADTKDKDKKKALETFYEVYGLKKEDPEVYFRNMGALENFKSLKLRRNTKWGNVFDKSDMAASFTKGLFGHPEQSESDSSEKEMKAVPRVSKSSALKQDTTLTENTVDTSVMTGKLLRGGTQTTIHESTGTDNFIPLPHVKGSIPVISENAQEPEVKMKKNAAKPAFSSKGLHKVKSDMNDGPTAEDHVSKFPNEERLKQTTKLPPIVLNRNRKVSENAVDDSDRESSSDNKEKTKDSKQKFFQTPKMHTSLPNLNSLEKTKTSLDEPPSSPTETNKTFKSDRKNRKRKRITSAALITQAKAAEGAVPLPMISHENQTRPFFYHNGMREEDVVNPMMDLVTRHQGSTARDRAIKSLTIANSFKEKPWLTQVRMALSLTSQSIKRPLKGTSLRRKLLKQAQFD